MKIKGVRGCEVARTGCVAQTERGLPTEWNVTSRWCCIIAALVSLCCSLPAQEKQAGAVDDTRAYLEMLLSQSNSNKLATYNEVLKLTPEEGEKFWPIYRDYEKELATLSARRLDLIREFLGRGGKLTDKDATELANRWFPNLEDRTALWKKYHKKISKAISPVRAAQFLQLEYELTLFVDLAISSEIPRLGAAPGGAEATKK